MTRTGWKKKKEPPKGKEEGWLLSIEYQYRRVRKNKPVGADGTDRRNNPKKRKKKDAGDSLKNYIIFDIYFQNNRATVAVSEWERGRNVYFRHSYNQDTSDVPSL